MRILAPLLAACLGAAATTDGVTVGQWNGMLIVTAPASSGIGALGSRLDQHVTLDARDQPLSETADFLHAVTGLNVVVAPAILANPPLLTLQVKDMELRNLLRWIERTTAVHVGFVHGALFFSDQPVVGTRVTKLYDVRDLGMISPDFPGPDLTIPQSGGNGVSVIPPLDVGQDKPHYDLDEVQHLIEQFVLNQK